MSRKSSVHKKSFFINFFVCFEPYIYYNIYINVNEKIIFAIINVTIRFFYLRN